MAHRAIITATVISTYERIFKTVAPKVCWLLTEILSPPTIMTFFPGKTLKSASPLPKRTANVASSSLSM